MSKLYSGPKIIKALIRCGFYIVSTKGSHIKLRGIRFGKIQTVIVPKHREVALGTFQSILKQASMDYLELKKYLK
ncbi:MAG: type II toxin-antitoxin system HicA family toxin [Candidatus Levybacteria bacterium]|nr:type II toxin-antitoxin system HicA family toxin [Candidatus Levybacteria bacterium]